MGGVREHQRCSATVGAQPRLYLRGDQRNAAPNRRLRIQAQTASMKGLPKKVPEIQVEVPQAPEFRILFYFSFCFLIKTFSLVLNKKKLITKRRSFLRFQLELVASCLVSGSFGMRSLLVSTSWYAKPSGCLCSRPTKGHASWGSHRSAVPRE